MQGKTFSGDLVHLPPMHAEQLQVAEIDAVVVSYNTCALLRDCLQSARESTLRVRIVVVDNASRDGSAAMVRREFPEVGLIANAQNRGFAAGTNQGLAAVRPVSDFVLLLNPDARLLPGALEALVGFLQQHPRVGVAGARLVYPDGRHQHAAFRFPTLAMALFDLMPPRGPLLGRLYDSYLNGRYPEEHGATPFPIDHPLGAVMLMRRQTLDEVGLFDEGYWLYSEEVDWCYRCRQAGWAIWQVPAAQVVHVAGASSSQFKGRSFIALHAARLRFEHKWRSPIHQAWYGRLISVGMVVVTLQTWADWLRRGLTTDDLRARLLAYGMVARAVRDSPLTTDLLLP